MIGVGVIGAGFISDVHLEALAGDRRVDLKAIADVDLPAAQTQAERFGVPRAESDYRLLLDDPTIDVVDIAAPHFLHLPMTLDAHAAGKDVLCEKPIAIDLDEADRMIASARDSGRRLLIKKYQRFSPPHVAARRLIEDGTIGRPYLATATVVAQQLHWENDPDNWHGVRERAGGGVVMDTGIHLLDLMQFLLGPVQAVTATTRRLVAANPEKAEDTGVVVVEHERGAIANVTACNCDGSLPGMTLRKDVLGTEGALQIYERDGLTKLDLIAGGTAREVTSVRDWWRQANLAAVRHLVDCVVDGAAPVATLEEARHDLEIVHAAYRSSDTGARVVLAR